MVSKYLSVGNKVELTKVQSAQSEEPSVKRKVYVSQVYDIVDDTKVKLGMPIENGHVVAIPPRTRLNACFYTAKGLYHGRVVVVERMREANMYLMVVELQYELKKFQRRQYYRLSCTMDLLYRPMEEEEIKDFIEHGDIPDVSQLQGYLNGVALDFSGGGIRFISQEKYAKEDLILIRLKISYGDVCKIYVLPGRIIASIEGKSAVKRYENRVEFVGINSRIREEIIQYIFMEERRQRQKNVDSR